LNRQDVQIAENKPTTHRTQRTQRRKSAYTHISAIVVAVVVDDDVTLM
jgi:hypothetical protein